MDIAWAYIKQIEKLKHSFGEAFIAEIEPILKNKLQGSLLDVVKRFKNPEEFHTWLLAFYIAQSIRKANQVFSQLGLDLNRKKRVRIPKGWEVVEGGRNV